MIKYTEIILYILKVLAFVRPEDYPENIMKQMPNIHGNHQRHLWHVP
jgi:hypothetical protein